MRKITNRALCVLLIAAGVIFGMIVYVLNYIDHGQDWALYFSRSNSGSTGMLLDRSGIVLASFGGADEFFSPDAETRMSNYHVTGDYWGRTGTGILSRYRRDVNGFSLLTGTTRTENSTLTLTVDARLNNKIYELLDTEHNAAVLVCNYKTGELLGMVSAPTVDPLDVENGVRTGVSQPLPLPPRSPPARHSSSSPRPPAIENIPDIKRGCILLLRGRI